MKYDLTNPAVKKQAEDAEKGFQPLPAGDHYVRCTEVTFKIKNEKPAWELQLCVMPGEPHEHEMVRDTLFFTDKALGRMLLCLSAFGLKDAELSAIDPDDEKCRNMLIGKTAIVTVEHSDPSKDKTGKNRVYANPTYAGYAVAHQGSLKEMRDTRANAPAAPATPAAGSKSAAGGGVDYGNVPF